MRDLEVDLELYKFRRAKALEHGFVTYAKEMDLLIEYCERAMVTERQLREREANKELVEALEQSVCVIEALPGLGNHRWGAEAQMVIEDWKGVLAKAKEGLE